MKRANEKTITIVLMVVMILLLLVSAGLIFLVTINKGKDEPVDVTYRTFADWTEYEIFAEIPVITGEEVKVGKVTDNNFDNYSIEVDYTTKDDYKNYLNMLEEYGFEKYVDNGENGFDGSVFNSTYIKDNLVVTIVHLDPIDKTYVSAQYDQDMSEHLFYDKSYVSGNVEGAKATLTMPELYDYGNSLIYQLKNGHFIISDGGRAQDLPFLIDYLESLAPEGEKPVVEAWFFTHAHIDHVGVMTQLYNDMTQGERLYVEGIYYNMVSSATIAEEDSGNGATAWAVKYGAAGLKTTEGTIPKIYRTTTGQRYYFNDITIDILMAQEQVTVENYVTDLNESTTWCLVTLDEQKVLMTGDAGRGSMSCVMRVYSKEFLDVDIMTSMHHSSDTWDVFTNYCATDVYLVTRSDVKESDANKYLMSKVQETYTFGNGGVVLSFPYVVGTAKLLPLIEWE